ncbi:MAG: hypothetical protein A2064_13565 [Spirochaetes bacterium GWB1_66_5]|nr:MAG: hypothetical protein A2064_13565 [Spirochaetes bacterium GWB1_66_5]
MLDWHSEYLVIQARQREIAAAAEFSRQARDSAPRKGRAVRARSGPGLRWRAGAALVLLGRRLQGDPSRLAEKC